MLYHDNYLSEVMIGLVKSLVEVSMELEPLFDRMSMDWVRIVRKISDCKEI